MLSPGNPSSVTIHTTKNNPFQRRFTATMAATKGVQVDNVALSSLSDPDDLELATLGKKPVLRVRLTHPIPSHKAPS
jgi:hypothetical protein